MHAINLLYTKITIITKIFKFAAYCIFKGKVAMLRIDLHLCIQVYIHTYLLATYVPYLICCVQVRSSITLHLTKLVSLSL